MISTQERFCQQIRLSFFVCFESSESVKNEFWKQGLKLRGRSQSIKVKNYRNIITLVENVTWKHDKQFTKLRIPSFGYFKEVFVLQKLKYLF